MFSKNDGRCDNIHLFSGDWERGDGGYCDHHKSRLVGKRCVELYTICWPTLSETFAKANHPDC